MKKKNFIQNMNTYKLGLYSLIFMFSTVLIISLFMQGTSKLEVNDTFSCQSIATDLQRFGKEYKHFHEYGGSQEKRIRLIKLYREITSKNVRSGCNIPQPSLEYMLRELRR